MMHNLYIRGRDGKGYLLSNSEYHERFKRDAIRIKGKVVGYIHELHDDYICVSYDLHTIALRQTYKEARDALSLHLKHN